MTTRWQGLWGGLAFALLAACATAAPPPRIEAPSFADRPPISLDVAEVRVTSNYRPPRQSPQVGHEPPVTLAEAAAAWADQRLRATGASGGAAFVIEEASVTETRLETEGGIRGLFRNQAETRYDGVLLVRLVALDGDRRGTLEVTVTRDQTVLERATLNERERARNDMVARMIDDLNTEVEARLATFLSDFLR